METNTITASSACHRWTIITILKDGADRTTYRGKQGSRVVNLSLENGVKPTDGLFDDAMRFAIQKHIAKLH